MIGVIECLVICHGDGTHVGAQLEFHPSHKILHAPVMNHIKILYCFKTKDSHGMGEQHVWPS